MICGGLWSFAVVCGRLQWFVVVCLSHTEKMTRPVALSTNWPVARDREIKQANRTVN